MQWYVETSVVINGVQSIALVDVVPLLQPFFRRSQAHVAAPFGPNFDCDGDAFWKIIWKNGRAEPPAPTPKTNKLAILGWTAGSSRSKIGLVKLVRHWTRGTLTSALALVNLLDCHPGWFELDLDRTEQERKDAIDELRALGVCYEER